MQGRNLTVNNLWCFKDGISLEIMILNYIIFTSRMIAEFLNQFSFSRLRKPLI